MNEKIENPPAFPFKGRRASGNGDMTDAYHYGMTLRDYFARGVMKSIISNLNFTVERLADKKLDVIAKESYTMADAMLKERCK